MTDAAAANSWRLPGRHWDMHSAIYRAVRGAGMSRCPAHGNRIQRIPLRAANLYGATTQTDCRRSQRIFMGSKHGDVSPQMQEIEGFNRLSLGVEKR